MAKGNLNNTKVGNLEKTSSKGVAKSVGAHTAVEVFTTDAEASLTKPSGGEGSVSVAREERERKVGGSVRVRKDNIRMTEKARLEQIRDRERAG
jgi:hypothetical protein